MSGSYNELDVPPTLVSFCIGDVDTEKVVSNEFKKANSKVMLLKTKMGQENIIDFDLCIALCVVISALYAILLYIYIIIYSYYIWILFF